MFIGRDGAAATIDKLPQLDTTQSAQSSREVSILLSTPPRPRSVAIIVPAVDLSSHKSKSDHVPDTATDDILLAPEGVCADDSVNNEVLTISPHKKSRRLGQNLARFSDQPDHLLRSVSADSDEGGDLSDGDGSDREEVVDNSMPDVSNLAWTDTLSGENRPKIPITAPWANPTPTVDPVLLQQILKENSIIGCWNACYPITLTRATVRLTNLNATTRIQRHNTMGGLKKKLKSYVDSFSLFLSIHSFIHPSI